MSLDFHTVVSPDGAAPTFTDNVVIGVLYNVANIAAAGAGDNVTVSVTGMELPCDGSNNGLYGVQVTPNQAAFASVTSKTRTGFTVTLTPPTSSIQLSVGTIDVVIFA